MTRPGWISKLNVAYKLNQWNFNLNMTPRPANVTTPYQLYTMSFNTRLLNPSGLGVNPARQFGRAKLAQMMYIKNLALRMRDSNLAAIAVCPGKKIFICWRSRQFQIRCNVPEKRCGGSANALVDKSGRFSPYSGVKSPFL